ncbi:hypothetical protein Tco_1272887 [Tanacetum coccineum]
MEKSIALLTYFGTVREIHRRSYLVEITDGEHEGDFGKNAGILITLGGCFKQLSHSTIIGHRDYGRSLILNWFYKIKWFNKSRWDIVVVDGLELRD